MNFCKWKLIITLILCHVFLILVLAIAGCLSSEKRITENDDSSIRNELFEIKKHGIRIGAELQKLNKEIQKINSNFFYGNSKEFSILFSGDILLANGVKKYIKRKGIEYPFQRIRGEFFRYDYTFANLETPITRRGRAVKGKPYVFRVAPEIAEFLSMLKLDVVSISNNHLMDYGIEGMKDTMDILDKWRIKYAGAGNNLSEARKPVILKHGLTEVIILAYCERPPSSFYATDSKPGIAPFNVSYITRDILKYKKPDNVVLISVHWGIEQTSRPQSYQVRAAHRIIDAGADGIIGHHPHWPQGIEVYSNRPVVYSLGNLINGFYNRIEKNNIMVGLYYRTNNLQKIEVIPVAGKNRQIKFQPSILCGKSAVRSLKIMRCLSGEFGTKFEIKNDRGIINFQ